MYSFKINNKKSLAIGIVFVCIFIALTVRLYVLMIHPTSTVQGELKNHQVEYSSDNNYKIFDTNGENLINYKNKYIKPYLKLKKCKGVIRNASKLSNGIRYKTKQSLN